MREHKKTSEVRKNAPKMHQDSEGRREKEATRHPKTSLKYWEGRVSKRSSHGLYEVQISHQNRRHRFSLYTAEKSAAADRAKLIFLEIVAKGWDETLAKHKPQVEKKPDGFATVGELIHAVESTVSYKPQTFATYCRRLRQIVSDIAGIGDQPKMTARGKPAKDRKGRVLTLSRRNGSGNALWITEVDKVGLDVLTPAAIQAWRIELENKAGTSPQARESARRNADSVIRNARSLFTPTALEFVTLNLPDPLPFTGAKVKKPKSSFRSKSNVPALIARARQELTGEPLKIFLLAMLAGLRKNEIDKLEWASVDFFKREVSLAPTEWFEAKTEEGNGSVDIEPELMAMMQSWMVATPGSFVVHSDTPPRPPSKSAHYRCKEHFTTLYKWLRGQGITAQKPLHELRKELGSHLASEQGIYAAQQVMRHAQISTTAEFYTDKKRAIVSGLGAFLAAPTEPDNVTPADFSPPIQEAVLGVKKGRR